MVRTGRLSRRTVLRGMGAAIALPWLEAMAPITARARGPEASADPQTGRVLVRPQRRPYARLDAGKDRRRLHLHADSPGAGAIPGRLARALRAVAE